MYPLHHLGFGAFRTQDVVGIGDEPFANKTALTRSTDETFVVPMSVLEGDVARATNSCDWLSARCTSLSKQISVTLSTVRLLVSAGESFSGQTLGTIRARETLSVPRIVLVRHSSRSDDLTTLDAPSRELLLVAASAVNVLFPWNEGLRSDWGFARATTETLFVPLSGLVLHFLHPCSKHV